MMKMFVSNKAVLVNPVGKILILTLPDGRWDLPGGRLNEGDGMLDGLAREVLEETGLAIDTSKARPFFTNVYPYKYEPPEPCASVFYVVPIGDTPTITLSSEHTSLFWVDPRQPFGPAATGPIVEILEAYRNAEGIIVAADASIKGRQGLGLIQVFTGNGKGKTTASLGEVIRMVGAGKKAAIIYFDKGGNTHYSERSVLDRLNIPFVATGRDRIDPITNRFDFSIQQIDRDEAQRGLATVRDFFKQNYDVIVLDEINSTTDLGMLTVDEVLSILDEKPDAIELVLTGRNAPQAFLDRAHLVTEMKLRKHYFYSGVSAREGIDY